MTRQKTYRVPAGRVVGLTDLRARMATANDLAYHLELTSDTDDFAEVMEALHEAYWIAAALASRASRTGCREHPHGPVDPEAPEGWGVCLLCNSRRRIGQVKAREIHGQPLTGATAEINRPRRSVETAREPSPPEAAEWREPAAQHPPVLDSPILVHRRADQDRTHAAALARARADKAARKDGDPT
ncbi:hypothetical protein VSR01_16555 [Actinacidiphila sp. DG2A-62]|uniref:hypothetical protein n=1 Tax=Actinacidiphila sp. DG2A-62 TaxID=3108821 RepID=UPI002DB8DB3D|nr:hypothetical protein [Actinacidiphila sp. DG2A-62]MEC3995058.1 hypothetical protein [Actinacidiphila sp. DG2A-62]